MVFFPCSCACVKFLTRKTQSEWEKLRNPNQQSADSLKKKKKKNTTKANKCGPRTSEISDVEMSEFENENVLT